MEIITHCGLYFSPEDIAAAQQAMDQPPYADAWNLLRERQPPGVESALMAGFRHRFQNDEAAADAGINVLVRALSEPISDDRAYLEQVGESLSLIQTFEMLRERTVQAGQFEEICQLITHRVEQLAADPRDDTFTESLWVAALRMCAGVSLEHQPWFEEGVGIFQQVVANEVRPQGHITRAVEGRDGGAMFRQIVSVAALVIMAEAARNVNVDLWSFGVRGVTVSTAAMYPIYYFYTTAKWKWDTDLQVDEVQMMFRRYGGWLEMLYRQNRHKDIKTLLDDLRPVYSPTVGGLTTLTHGVVEKKRGFFG